MDELKPVKLITIYGTSMCPNCESVKSYLHHNRMLFDFKDISKDETAKAEAETFGASKLPLVVVNGKLFSEGLDLKTLEKLKSL